MSYIVTMPPPQKKKKQLGHLTRLIQGTSFSQQPNTCSRAGISTSFSAAGYQIDMVRGVSRSRTGDNTSSQLRKLMMKFQTMITIQKYALQ